MTRTNTALQARALALIFALLILAGSAAILLAASTATAQAQTTANNSTAPAGGERIHDDLLLVNKSYQEDGRNGTLTLTFVADGPTAVTLIDAGAFMAGGQLPQRTKVIEGRTKITMPVTRVENMVGVTIISGGVRYAVPHEVDGGVLSPPGPRIDSLALLTGVALVAVLAIGIYRIRANKRDEGVTVVDA